MGWAKVSLVRVAMVKRSEDSELWGVKKRTRSACRREISLFAKGGSPVVWRPWIMSQQATWVVAEIPNKLSTAG